MAEIVSIGPSSMSEKSAFCLTPTAEEISDLLTVCKETPDFGVIVGEPGVGKTEAAREFARSHAATWLVTMRPGSSQLVPCLELVKTIMKATPSGTGAFALREAIEFEIIRAAEYSRHAADRGALLIIDEAQHLADQSIEEIRSIFDAVKVGIVLVGNRGLVERWATKPGAKRTAWAQLTSRIGHYRDIASVSEDDIAAICQHHGINGKAVARLLYSRAQEIGGLRSVTKLIADAATLAGDGRRIELGHLNQAQQLRGPRRGG